MQRPSNLSALVFLLATLFALLYAPDTHAQNGPSILLSPDPSVSPALAQRVSGLCRQVAPVLLPGAPPRQGDLAVTSQVSVGADGMSVLHLKFYDAVSAALLFGHDVPLFRGEVHVALDSFLVGRIRQALGMLGAPVPPPAPQPPPPPTVQPYVPIQRPAPTYQAPQPEPDKQRDEPVEQEPSAAVEPRSPEPATPEPTTPEPAAAKRPVAIRFGVGVGSGMHAVELPTELGARRVPMSSFAAFDLSLELHATPSSGFAPGVRLQYHSSLGYTLTETSKDGTKQSSPARSHEVLLDALGNIYFGEPRFDASMYYGLGYAVQNLRTDFDLELPDYTLGGPHLLLGLRIPFASGHVLLTLSPDLCVLVQVSPALVRRATESIGYAIGAEAELAVHVSGAFALRVQYRETRASMASTYRGSFSDTKRFITTGVAAVY